MPFQSEKQRRFLHANHPEIAKRWEREYSHGGILDINESEEIISDDGNDIELTDYNAAFDDPNDLSTGVKSLFQAKDGGTPRRRYFKGAYGAGGTENRGSPSAGTAGSTGWGGPTQDTTPSDGGDDVKEQYIAGISKEAIEEKRQRDLKDATKGTLSDPHEKYDTWEQRLQDIPGLTTDNPYKGKFQKTHTKEILEEAERRQKAALNKWGLGQLGKLGVMLAAMLAMGVPFMDAIKAVPKTISLSKKDLATIVKESYPVMKAKKAHINALQDYKTSLLKGVDITNPNEMVNVEETTEFTETMNELKDLTQTRDEDDDTKGGPELPPQLGGTSTEEMAREYIEPTDWMSGLRQNQARKKAYDEKIAREKNPIVGTTEMDIIALGNSGGLANLFRVKNQ